MCRAGFDIKFLNEPEKEEKQCEFLATHKGTGLVVGVEAKSRHRPGVLHRKGSFEYKADARGLENLIRDAKHQKPKDLPFLVFLDINLPPTPDVPMAEKPWLRDAIGAMRLQDIHAKGEAHPYNALFFLNFSAHFAEREDAPPGERGYWISPRPLSEIPDGNVLRDVVAAFERYGRIPDEI